jgi:hypothetical protein
VGSVGASSWALADAGGPRDSTAAPQAYSEGKPSRRPVALSR